jgi:GTP-binding protein
MLGSPINKHVDQPKKLKTSGRPGKTFNHSNKQQLVLSRFTRIWLRESIKKTKSVFQQFITDYFETREQLVCFVLIDIRHEAQTIDIEFMSIWEKVKSPFIIFIKQTRLVK